MDRAGKSEAIKWARLWNDIRTAIKEAPEPDPREWKVFLGPAVAEAAIKAGLVRPEDVVITKPIPTDYPPH